MYRQNIQYEIYRGIQRKLQKIIGIEKWKIDKNSIFNDSWVDSDAPVRKITYGWFYYCSIIILLSIFLFFLIWFE
ncbi:hypothetical protein LEP1GSC192_3637 [Leptospira sp. B5-022]|nr:hypothetical protein LEP1GSC192_3637 [Leptospira sp. B5-022]